MSSKQIIEWLREVRSGRNRSEKWRLPESISGERVPRELMAVIERRGKPAVIVSDHGTEFTSNAILAWAEQYRTEGHRIALGKPMQNGALKRVPAALSEVMIILESIALDIVFIPP